MKTTCLTKWLCFKPTDSLKGFGLILLSAVIAGCSQAKPEKIVILGSNTIGEELAPLLVAEYRKEHPAIAVEMEFKGTSYGMGALMVSRCDIAAASREATTNEITLAKARGIEFDDHIIGAYDVTVIVNAGSPLTDLTKEQVRNLFTGATANWKDVGGPDAPVNLYIRHPISGTHLGFRELAMENKPYAINVKTFTNYTEIVQSVAQDPHGIGYSTIPLASKPGVKAISIGGVAPTVEAVNKGLYPYARVLRLYTDKLNSTPAARAFIDFVESERGQALVNQLGFAPRP
ncbi:MAG TPA: phosphate ABC transporter substrate-binding protein [Candidatus Paceibacterota bacterium]|nr:phosphate ABC transporter substrate-binding protein [Verrucomicrobiota bacterium]HSA12326.1 phosphate ABC transporter substrate-binding protein [Candidatus Paceibacterota bacterium]